MPLTQFTKDNVVDLIRILDLNINQIEDSSYLTNSLLYLEERDLEFDTNYVLNIQDAIVELVILEDKLTSLQSGKFYGANEISEDIDGEYSYTVRYGRRSSGIESGLKARHRYLIRQIKRLLEWSHYDNKICLG